MKPVVFSLPSQIEFWDAIDYYQHAAGDRTVARFRANVEFARDRMSRFPYLFGKVDRRHRAAPVRRFPFALIYRVRRDRIEVVSIHHVRKSKIET
jgi:plasmid stabilization system protein ParE